MKCFLVIAVHMRMQSLATELRAYAGSDLDAKEDKQLVKELKSLVGKEVQWPKGEPNDTPDRGTWKWFAASRAPGFHKTLVSNRSRTEARAQHVHVFEWLARHHRGVAVQPELSARLGHRMVRLGLIPHRRQWCEILNEQLASFPLKDPAVDEIPWPGLRDALQWLEGNFTNVMLPAYERSYQMENFYQEHNEGIHVTGQWEAAYFLSHPKKCKTADFPEMCKLLNDVDGALPTTVGVQQARFARMQPGTIVVEHTADTNQRIKIHCGVVNPSGVTMEIADTKLTWQEGRCYVVDDSYAHSIEAKSDAAARTILELKITHPDLAWAQALHDDEGHLLERNPYRKLVERKEL